MSATDCKDNENNSDTSSSYDSVCFGEYTMEEAKKDIRKGPPNKIERRHSAISRYEHYDKSSKAELITAQLDTASISSSPSNYFTPNATASTEAKSESQGPEFLQKLCEAINEPVSGSFYEIALDRQGEALEKTVDSVPRSSYEIFFGQQREKEIELISRLSSFNQRSVCQEQHEAVAEVRSESSYETEKIELVSRLSFNTASGCQKQGEGLQNNAVSEGSIDYNDCTNSLEKSPSDNQSAEALLEESIITISDDSVLEPETPTSPLYSTTSDEDPKVVKEYPETTNEFAEECYTSSPVNIEDEEANYEIDFDDTLEEMNRFLEQGTDYVMPNNSACAKLDVTPISGSFVTPKDKMKKPYSAGKIPKPTFEISRPRHDSNSKVLKAEIKTTPTFKVPSKPLKKATTPDMKNIVSPVGIYINHTRKYSPMIKVANNAKARLNLEPQLCPLKETSPNVEVGMEIPSVIYRPAKTKIASEVRDVNLPNSIKKLVSPQVVTKHEKRIERDMCNESVERRLLESDLSIDQSQCQDSDISILTHKQPFNLRKF